VIQATTDGDVAVVTIDRPERRNAVDHDSLLALRAAIDQARADRVRALVLTGASGTFCAGADLTGVEGEGFAAALQAVLMGLTELPAATIAAVHGAALGAGCQLALACDLRVAAPGAFFGIPASRLGLMVDAWTVQRLAQLAGGSVARAVLLAADTVPAEEARGFGLVNRMGDLDTALDWARTIARLAPLSVAGHKRALERLQPPGTADEELARIIAEVWSSADAQEGRLAFLEKRTPRFEGR
jgi:enoyl-CoA hydratase